MLFTHPSPMLPSHMSQRQRLGLNSLKSFIYETKHFSQCKLSYMLGMKESALLPGFIYHVATFEVTDIHHMFSMEHLLIIINNGNINL
ncbi:CLUMA_CG015502, isoform A [Clunio marinus]|uniref:CLUMA_CG015502, isoform A n=1 Tax=Clunio marinus TaxID=568069 RepID=A0A1J1IQA5_9DIPT|nr:CLUMA_CG015502, isoform A [Clunio marinus]